MKVGAKSLKDILRVIEWSVAGGMFILVVELETSMVVAPTVDASRRNAGVGW